jgi:hypothetical protein
MRSSVEAHLDTDTVLENRVGSINGDLVVSLVTGGRERRRSAPVERQAAASEGSGRCNSPVLEAEVVVLELNVEEGSDELVTDLGPAVHGGTEVRLVLAREAARPTTGESGGVGGFWRGVGE